MGAGGVVGDSWYKSYITNCVSSVDISSVEYIGGGFIGGFSCDGEVEITGCVFNGKIVAHGVHRTFVPPCHLGLLHDALLHDIASSLLHHLTVVATPTLLVLRVQQLHSATGTVVDRFHDQPALIQAEAHKFGMLPLPFAQHELAAIVVAKQHRRAVLVHHYCLLPCIVDAPTQTVAVGIGNVGAPLGRALVGKVVTVVFLVVGAVQQCLMALVNITTSPLEITGVAAREQQSI